VAGLRTDVSSYGPRSWLDRWLNLCVSLFIASAAIYGAVWLIEAVWVPLLVIVGTAVVLVASVTVLWRRHRGW
jgi:Na+/glutamate symporter